MPLTSYAYAGIYRGAASFVDRIDRVTYGQVHRTLSGVRVSMRRSATPAAQGFVLVTELQAEEFSALVSSLSHADRRVILEYLRVTLERQGYDGADSCGRDRDLT
jgi:hypothetical protein